MSWIGLGYKGVEPLYPDEWNRAIDALDILYAYTQSHSEKLNELQNRMDCLESKVDQYYFEVKRELSEIETKVEEIYELTKRPSSIDTFSKIVSTTPVPISDVDRLIKRLHIKVPSTASYIVYLGDSSKQEFILEPGDKEILEIDNAKKVYVRSLGDVTIFILLEE